MDDFYLVDTHTHIDMEEEFPDLEDVIKRASEAGVKKIIIPATDVSYFQRILAIAAAHENVYCALGIHPTEFKEIKDENFEKIIEFSKEPKVVGIGECGLDYYWEKDPKKIEEQKEVFLRQIKIAKQVKLPLLVHAREACKDSFDLLTQNVNGEIDVIMHCFSGSVEFAQECLKKGYYLGFGGALTFKNSKKAKEIVKMMPLERLLLETDAPYMTPVPHRGERNEPRHVREVAEYVAELRGITLEEVARATTENVRKVFGF